MSLVIFHHPLHAALAQGVRSRLLGTSLGCVDWKNFADGTPNLFIEGLAQCAGRDIVYVALFRPETFFVEYAVLRSLIRRHIRSLHIVLPYFPYGTMERESEMGEVATAKTLLSLLDGLPQCAKGALPFMTTYDMHATSLPFYSDDKLQLRNQTTLRHLEQILKTSSEKSIAIAFPDKGARIRFDAHVKRMFPNMPIVVCEKTRRGDDRDITVLEGDPSGKHIIILDDLVQSGGTLIECAKLMKVSGATAVSTFTPHGVCPEDAWKKFDHDTFAVSWFTDSVPGMTEHWGKGSIRILSLAGLIAEDIRWYPSI